MSDHDHDITLDADYELLEPSEKRFRVKTSLMLAIILSWLVMLAWLWLLYQPSDEDGFMSDVAEVLPAPTLHQPEPPTMPAETPVETIAERVEEQAFAEQAVRETIESDEGEESTDYNPPDEPLPLALLLNLTLDTRMRLESGLPIDGNVDLLVRLSQGDRFLHEMYEQLRELASIQRSSYSSLTSGLTEIELETSAAYDGWWSQWLGRWVQVREAGDDSHAGLHAAKLAFADHNLALTRELLTPYADSEEPVALWLDALDSYEQQADVIDNTLERLVAISEQPPAADVPMEMPAEAPAPKAVPAAPISAAPLPVPDDNVPPSELPQ